ncbi:MAG: NAD kinase [Acidimicrobiia bacterium]|nr:MAG: NAD kinase [Acidimicrobiia bacterium]
MSAVRAVGLVPHRDRPLAHTLAQAAAAWFGERGVEVRLPAEEAKAAGLPHLASAIESFAAGLDLVVSIGGDGTMLHTVQLAYPAGVPMLGVNAGQLGYLTTIEPAELDGALPRLLAGDFAVVERTMLEVDVTAAGASRREHALNEAVLEKRQPGPPRALRAVDQRDAVHHLCGRRRDRRDADGQHGLLVLGARPDRVARARVPDADAHLAAHAVRPHAGARAPTRSWTSRCVGNREVVCTMDGRHVDVLQPGDRVVCRVAADPLRVVELRPRDFHQILKAKFSLPDR